MFIDCREMAKQMPIAINMKSANILFFAYHEISDINGKTRV